LKWTRIQSESESFKMECDQMQSKSNFSSP
jgi:hypothetical protein